MSKDKDTRPLTVDEDCYNSSAFSDTYYTLTQDRVQATFLDQVIYSSNRDFPWYFSSTGNEVHTVHFETVFPGFRYIQKADWYDLTGEYNNKHVSWLPARNCWVYKNNREVKFTTDSPNDSQEEDTQAKTPEEPGSPTSKTPSGSSDQAEVSQLLDSATSTVTALITQVS